MNFRRYPFSSARLHTGKACRGAAEVELLYVIPILLIFIFMIGAMLVLGPARILNVVKPNEMAYRDATATGDPQLSSSSEPEVVLDPMLKINKSLPTLPNRVHTAESDQLEILKLGTVQLKPFTLVNKATYPAPTWAYSSWPDPADALPLQDWMQAYAEQSKEAVEDPLKLGPAFPP